MFACAFGVSLVGTPYAKKLSVKVGAIDYPRKRGMHKEPIPRMGGVAIFFGFLVAFGIAVIFMSELRSRQAVGLVLGAIIILASGMIDDIYSLKPRYKLITQFIASLVVVLTGTRLNIHMPPISGYINAFSIPLTMLWIMGMTNAVNYIDGLDGLAAGVSTIAALCLTALCVITGSPVAVVLSAAVAGSCMGFLPRNFSPAEVIMGDTGALFLGYVLAVTSIIGLFKGYAVLAVLTAFFALSLPIFDIVFATLRRMIRRYSITDADDAKGHIHYRLMASGFTTRQSVFILYALSTVSAILAVVIAIENIWALIITIVGLGIMLVTIYMYRKRI